eukprot:UN28490
MEEILSAVPFNEPSLSPSFSPVSNAPARFPSIQPSLNPVEASPEEICVDCSVIKDKGDCLEKVASSSCYWDWGTSCRSHCEGPFNGFLKDVQATTLDNFVFVDGPIHCE